MTKTAKEVLRNAEAWSNLRDFGDSFDKDVWLYLCDIPEDVLRAYFGNISLIGAILEAEERECK